MRILLGPFSIVRFLRQHLDTLPFKADLNVYRLTENLYLNILILTRFHRGMSSSIY